MSQAPKPRDDPAAALVRRLRLARTRFDDLDRIAPRSPEWFIMRDLLGDLLAVLEIQHLRREQIEWNRRQA